MWGVHLKKVLLENLGDKWTIKKRVGIWENEAQSSVLYRGPKESVRTEVLIEGHCWLSWTSTGLISDHYKDSREGCANTEPHEGRSASIIQSLSLWSGSHWDRISSILGATHEPLLSSASLRAGWAPQSQSRWLQLCGIHIRPKGSNPPRLLWKSCHQWVPGLKDIKGWGSFTGFHVRKIATFIHQNHHDCGWSESSCTDSCCREAILELSLLN